jgi:FMN-dependent NADH-azoreductase
MPNLLVIESSPRGDYSISRALTSKFVEAWQKNHANGQVVTRDLAKTTLPFVDLPWIAGAYTPTEQHSPEMQQSLQLSNSSRSSRPPTTSSSAPPCTTSPPPPSSRPTSTRSCA